MAAAERTPCSPAACVFGPSVNSSTAVHQQQLGRDAVPSNRRLHTPSLHLASDDNSSGGSGRTDS
jgi:hypothetical protein